MRMIDTAPFDIKFMDIPGGAEDYKQGYIDGARHVLEEMDEAPTVDAVPLDKFCELLAKNADCPPEHSPVQDHCIQTKCAECWKSVLKEWMEEQNA